MAFGKLFNVHLGHLGEGHIQLAGQSGAIPEDIPQFVEDFGFAVGGEAAGVIADDFFELIGYFARLPGKAQADIAEGGFTGIRRENGGFSLVFVDGVGVHGDIV